MVAATTLPPVEPNHVHLPVISRLPTVDTWTPQWPHGHAHRILVCPGQTWPCPPATTMHTDMLPQCQAAHI